MLFEYIQGALERAAYKKLDGTWFAGDMDLRKLVQSIKGRYKGIIQWLH